LGRYLCEHPGVSHNAALRHIDVIRIQLNPYAVAAKSISDKPSSASAEKRIEDDARNGGRIASAASAPFTDALSHARQDAGLDRAGVLDAGGGVILGGPSVVGA